jgi:hypothetical protein
MNRRRLVAVLVLIGLIALGAWTYSSGSVATGATAAAAPTTTVAPNANAPTTTRSPSSSTPVSTTTPAPTTTVAANPVAYSTALLRNWLDRNRDGLAQLASDDVVRMLFARHKFADEKWAAKACTAASGATVCTWASSRRTFVFTVRNAAGGVPMLVVKMQVLRA